MSSVKQKTAARRNVKKVAASENRQDPRPDQVPDNERTGDEPNPSGQVPDPQAHGSSASRSATGWAPVRRSLP